MKYIVKQFSILLLMASVFIACQPEIDDYFYKDTDEEYVNTDVLSLLKENPDYTSFVDLVEEVNGDSIFNNGNVFTLFVPTNEAFNNLDPTISSQDLFNYLVTESYISIHQIEQEAMLQSYGGKFVKFEVLGDSAFVYDGVDITKGSPLANNGRYYELADMVNPRPNIYEYFARSNPFFKAYYDNEDSIYLDKELSTPTGFDEDGNTVYDTVLSTINRFEEDYFEISEEFRSRRATMLVFSEQQYNDALVDVSTGLGIDSIPAAWQNDVLMPYVLDHSVFRNLVDYSTLQMGTVNNINNDSVDINPENIDPNYYECSNGRVYNYSNFGVPEELYMVNDTVFLIDRLTKLGDELYGWGTEFEITGTKFPPEISDTKSLIVDLGSRNYSEEFAFSYKHHNIFPGTYRIKFKMNLVGNIGTWKFFVNDQQLPLKQYPYQDFPSFWEWEYDLFDLRDGFISPYPSEISPLFSTYVYNGQTCMFEALVEEGTITTFGDVDVRLEYVEPTGGANSFNAGINIEYIALEYYEVQ